MDTQTFCIVLGSLVIASHLFGRSGNKQAGLDQKAKDAAEAKGKLLGEMAVRKWFSR